MKDKNITKPRQKINQLVIALLFMVIFFNINDFYFEEVSNGGQVFKTGDWLINYSAGYVRRGLAGEFSYDMSSLFNLNLLWTTAVFQSIILSLVFYFVLSLFFKSYRTQTELAILVSPAFLLFALYDVGSGFRKELLVFLAFVVFLQFLVHKRLSAISSGLVIFLYAFAAFSHELAAFFLPFFLVVSYVFYNSNVITKKHFICLSACFSLIAFLSALSAFLYSGVGKSEIICNSLLIHDVPKSLCDGGSIAALESNSEAGFKDVVTKITNHNYMVTYIQSIVLALIPFSLLDWKNYSSGKLALFFSISIVSALPLFFVALDWGRWINIYFFMLSTLAFALLNLKQLTVKYNFPFILVVVYGTFWSIPHCCRDYIGGALGQIEKHAIVPLMGYAEKFIGG